MQVNPANMKKVSITVHAGFCMGHRLPFHGGKCYNLHGHQYEVECSVVGEVSKEANAPDEGMVVDFTDIKQALKTLVDGTLDHKCLISNTDPLAVTLSYMPGVLIVNFVPTAENIARFILERLPQDVWHVKLWETPTSYVEVVR